MNQYSRGERPEITPVSEEEIFLHDVVHNPETALTREKITSRLEQLKATNSLEETKKENKLSGIAIEASVFGSGGEKGNMDAQFSFISPDGRFFIAGVLDGTSSGREMSRLIAQKFQQRITKRFEQYAVNPENVMSILQAEIIAIQSECSELIERKLGVSKANKSQYDTTITMAIGLPGKTPETMEILMVYAGDSPGYVVEYDGRTEKVTTDEGPVADLAIAAAAKKVHPQRNEIYYAALVANPRPLVDPEFLQFPYNVKKLTYKKPKLEQSLTLVLASDGFGDVVVDGNENQDDNEVRRLASFSASEMVAAAIVRQEQGAALDSGRSLSKSSQDDVVVSKISIGYPGLVGIRENAAVRIQSSVNGEQKEESVINRRNVIKAGAGLAALEAARRLINSIRVEEKQPSVLLEGGSTEKKSAGKTGKKSSGGKVPKKTSRRDFFKPFRSKKHEKKGK